MKKVQKCTGRHGCRSFRIPTLFSVGGTVPDLCLARRRGSVADSCGDEINKKWAFGVYASVSLLGVLVVPNKEVAVLTRHFFGFYPIVKAAIEKKMPRVVEYILKVLLFLVMMVSAYFLMIRFMGITIEETRVFRELCSSRIARYGCVAFLVYDSH
jgi:hypothetical protein